MAHQLYFPGLCPPEPAPEAFEAREALRDYPKIGGNVMARFAKQLGTAGELLFDSTMMRLGERTIPCSEHEPFDRILWLPDALVRVQIKTRHAISDGQYVFNIKKGYQRGPTGTKPYDPADFDLLALVILPENAIKFTADWRNTHRVALSEIARLRASPGASLRLALSDLGLSGICATPAAI
ncbi:group I intron-associated PD-(D/E)XK endonuclease [Roseinatronobacter sp. NSM]|uniref:group I intron-associated PD-(D/E)XK endonuclease n=1 Tax=Roseinatronobacter sp. NSM TaxID=3457785 RepID=UPI0040357471